MSIQRMERGPIQEETRKTTHLILISDSKGAQLKDVMTREDNRNTTFDIKAGRTTREGLDRIRQMIEYWKVMYQSLTIILWTGTCDYTKKSGQFVDKNDKIKEGATEHLQTMENIYDKHHIEIKYVETPYINIETWNQLKGHANSHLFRDKNKQINDILHNHNYAIRNLHPNYPKLALDTTKNKTRYRTNTILKDGIHPNKKVSDFWWKRIRVLWN